MSGERARIGYLTSQYPAPSHSFIQREVRDLRGLGVELETFTIRRCPPGELLTEEDRRSAAETFAIRPTGPLRVLRAHLACIRAAPSAYPRTLGFALRLGRGPRGLLKQLFYFAEAGILAPELAARGIARLHAHHGTPGGDVAMLATRLTPAVRGWSLTVHGSDVNLGDRRLLAAKLADADAVVCVSESGRSQLRELIAAGDAEKLRLIRCGISIGQFELEREPRPAEAPLRILTVARLDPLKGHAVALRALAELRDRGVEAEWNVVGDGPMRERLEAAAGELGLGGSVRFAGNVGQDRIATQYAEADLFCLPSFSEGLPIVLLEALAAGVPVVATRVHGIPELIEDSVNGLLVAPDSAGELAAAIERLAADPQERAALSAAGRERVREFDGIESATRLREMFERI